MSIHGKDITAETGTDSQGKKTEMIRTRFTDKLWQTTETKVMDWEANTT